MLDCLNDGTSNVNLLTSGTQRNLISTQNRSYQCLNLIMRMRNGTYNSWKENTSSYRLIIMIDHCHFLQSIIIFLRSLFQLESSGAAAYETTTTKYRANFRGLREKRCEAMHRRGKQKIKPKKMSGVKMPIPKWKSLSFALKCISIACICWLDAAHFVLMEIFIDVITGCRPFYCSPLNVQSKILL